jgi:Ulp1 family protease
MNDHEVEFVAVEDVLKKEAYLLFYSQKGSPNSQTNLREWNVPYRIHDEGLPVGSDSTRPLRKPLDVTMMLEKLRNGELSANEEELLFQRCLVMQPGEDDTVLIQKFKTTVYKSAFSRLAPGQWLSGNILCFYMGMVVERERLRGVRSHVFPHEFKYNLCDRHGHYCFQEVASWTSNIDVFSLERIYFLINVTGQHWTLVVIHMKDQELRYYDSLNNASNRNESVRILDHFHRWLFDEWRLKRGNAMYVNPYAFKKVLSDSTVYQQQNGFDCGPLVLLKAASISNDEQIQYTPATIRSMRTNIGIDILRGSFRDTGGIVASTLMKPNTNAPLESKWNETCASEMTVSKPILQKQPDVSVNQATGNICIRNALDIKKLRNDELSAHEEAKVFQNAVVMQPGEDEVFVIDKFNTRLYKSTFSRLAPGQWLSGAVLCFYLDMLVERERMRGVRSHLFPNEFKWKLCDANNGQYTFENVATWTSTIDVFLLERIYFLINVSEQHWTLVVLFMKDQEFRYYDSLNNECNRNESVRILDLLHRWLLDEWRRKRSNSTYLNPQAFKKVLSDSTVYQQQNDVDCGPLVLMNATSISNEVQMHYTRGTIRNMRRNIGIEILRGSFRDTRNLAANLLIKWLRMWRSQSVGQIRALLIREEIRYRFAYYGVLRPLDETGTAYLSATSNREEGELCGFTKSNNSILEEVKVWRVLQRLGKRSLRRVTVNTTATQESSGEQTCASVVILSDREFGGMKDIVTDKIPVSGKKTGTEVSLMTLSTALDSDKLYFANDKRICKNKDQSSKTQISNKPTGMWCKNRYSMDVWPPSGQIGGKDVWMEWVMPPLIMASVTDECLQVDANLEAQPKFLSRKHSTWTYSETQLPKGWDRWRSDLRQLLQAIDCHQKLDMFYVLIHDGEKYGEGPYIAKNQFNLRSLLVRWRHYFPVTYKDFRLYVTSLEGWCQTNINNTITADEDTPLQVTMKRHYLTVMESPSCKSNIDRTIQKHRGSEPTLQVLQTRNEENFASRMSTPQTLTVKCSGLFESTSVGNTFSGPVILNKEHFKGNWCHGMYSMNQWPPGMPARGKGNWKDWLMAPLLMSSVPEECLQVKLKSGIVKRTFERFHKAWTFSESDLPKNWDSWKTKLLEVLVNDFYRHDTLNERLIRIHRSNKLGAGPYTVVNHRTVDAYMRELGYKYPLTRQEIEVYGNTIQNRSELDTVGEIISRFMEGDLDTVQLHELECVNRMMNEDYLKDIFALQMDYCADCKQRWYVEEVKKAPAEGPYRCKACTDDLEELKFSRFSKSNGMDPLFHEDPAVVNRYKELLRECPLSNIEVSLISPYLSVMQVYRLKSQSQLFKGSCIAFPQRIAHIADVLPRKPSECPIFKVRMRSGMDPSGYKDFKVRREFLRNWLLFLREHNPYYQNLLPYSQEEFDNRLNEFPVDGSVYDEIQDIELPQDNIEQICKSRAEKSDNRAYDGNNEDLEDDDFVNHNGIPQFEDIMVSSVNECGSVDNETEVIEGILKRAMGVKTGKSTTENTASGEGEQSCSDGSPVTLENALGGTPVNDFSTSGFLAKCYPILFPFGVGDQTCSSGRVKTVRFSEAIKFYVKYFDVERGVYHFATNPRFLHHIQDMDERHRSQSQASVFIKNHPKFSKMTLLELKDVVANPLRKKELMELLKTLERYVANVNGSAAGMFNKKRQLLALMEQEGTANIWFTLTMPNWMWRDMQAVLGPPPLQTEGEDFTEYERRCSEHYRKLFTESPHIANEHFVRRARIFLKHFFGENCLNADWHWHRYEWQSRGNIHLHGMAKIPGADVQKLAKRVERGRKSLQFLHLFKETCHEYEDKIGELQPTKAYDKLNVPAMRDAVKKMFASKDKRAKDDVGDICGVEAKKNETLSSNSRSPTDHTYEFFDLLKLAVSEGCEAEAKLIHLRSFLCTSLNPNVQLPNDAQADVRDPPNQTSSFSAHPSTTLFDEYMSGGRFDFKSTFTYENYCRLVDCCQRHRHNQRYCMRHHRGSCKCRFQFPRPEMSDSRIVIIDHVYEKKDSMKGRTKRTEVKLQFETNDRWLNAHSRVGMCMWGANMDISLLIDEDTIVNYVAKYCAKSETPSTALRAVMNAKCNAGRLQGVDSASKILRQVMNYLGAGRDKTVSETCHLILSTPFVECTHRFTFINILKAKQKLNLGSKTKGSTENNETIVGESKDLLILYGHRMVLTSWNSHSDCIVAHQKYDLLNMPLIQFVKLFSASNGKISVRKLDVKPLICRFSPEIKYREKSEEFWKYCYVSLVKHKPWNGHVESVFGGVNGSVSNYVTAMPNAVKEAIMAEFKAYFRNSELRTYGGDDPLRRAIDSVILEDKIPTPVSQHSIDMEDELNGLLNGYYEEDDSNCNVSGTHRPSEFFANYREVIAAVRDMWTQLRLNASVQSERPKRYLRDFDRREAGSRQQYNVVVTFLKMLGLWRDRQGRFVDPDQVGGECSNAMLIPGPAGAGKSYVIDCLVTECEERYAEKHKSRDGKSKDVEGFVHVVAPTGKAAMGVGGYTMQSAAGLRVPCNSEGTFLGGDYLNEHQRYFNCKGKFEGKRLIAVVCDEYSMVSSIQMYWISRRLQEAAENHSTPFGGVCIAFFGDPAQLPPVCGSALWRTHTDKENKFPVRGRAKEGHLIYKAIKTVMKLDVVRRQNEVFASYLKKVRDRKITKKDLQLFWNLYCSVEGIGQERYEEFVNDLSTLFIYPTNAKCVEHNTTSLKQLGQPILRMKAEHDDKKYKGSANKSDSECGELEACLHLAVGCKVMLRRNIATHCGLVNGAVGQVIDFLYENENDPADFKLPAVIIVECESYTGPPFFPGEERRKWVGLLPYHLNIDPMAGTFRLQFPISLAYALTGHKSQGMTITGKAVVDIRNNQRTPGLLYVMLSRTTDVHNLCIGNAVALDEWTAKKDKHDILTYRLEEDARLELLMRETIKYFSRRRRR